MIFVLIGLLKFRLIDGLHYRQVDIRYNTPPISGCQFDVNVTARPLKERKSKVDSSGGGGRNVVRPVLKGELGMDLFFCHLRNVLFTFLV